jgi:hypothetical protein
MSNGVHVGVKCPKCGTSPTQSISIPVPDPLMFYCIGCDSHWQATPEERARAVAVASELNRRP